jgi:zinc protease
MAYQDTLNKIIYNNHPWMRSIPTAEDFDKISLDRSMAIYKEIYGNADGMHFTFVGNIDPAKAKPLLEKYIGALPGTPAVHESTDIGARMIKGYTEITLKRGKATQAMINLKFEGETAYDRQQQLYLSALLEVLNIEIIEKLREEMSGMYGGGMNGTIVKRPYAHYSIQASVPCGPENVDKLTEALIGIIRNAQEKGVAQKDLDKVKETWKKQYHVKLQDNDYWLESLSYAFINQYDPAEMLDYEQRVDAITTADLQKTAKQYITLENMVKSVLYPESATVKEAVKTVKKGF